MAEKEISASDSEPRALDDPDLKEFLEGRNIKEEDYPVIERVFAIPAKERKNIAVEYHNTYQFVRDDTVKVLEREIEREKTARSEEKEKPSAKMIYLEALKTIAENYDWTTAWNFNVVLERSKFEPARKTASEAVKKENVVDREFGILENEFNFSDGMNVARDMFDELDNYDSNLRRQTEFAGSLKLIRADGNSSIKHYFLPDIPGGNGYIEQIREGYTASSTYMKSGEHVFATVKQGEMWSIPLSENPYLKITMSECSLMVGKSGTDLIVAHISYSELDEIKAVIDFMMQKGVDISAIQVVASVGAYQEENSKGRRAASVDAYESLGISKENIVPFEFEFNNPQADTAVYHNMASVLVNRKGFFKWGYDLRDTYQILGPTPIREQKIGNYKDETVKEF